MTAICLEKQTPQVAGWIKSSVGLRVAIALVPAAILVSVWGDFARSVVIGDKLQPSIELAALTAASSTANREVAVASLQSELNARGDLRQVSVGVAGNPDRSVTVNVRAEVPSVFAPRLMPSFGIARSASSPGHVSFD